MSKASLSEFVSRVKTVGLARPSHFFVNIGGSLGSVSNTKDIMMMCDSVNIPGVNIMTYEIRQFGELTNMPTGIIYPPVNMTFYVDNSMEVKRYFHDWINQVYNRETRFVGYYGEYVRDVQIYVLDMTSKIIHTVILYEAYPDSISDVELSYADEGLMKLNVKLNYKWWKTNLISSGSNNINLSNNIRSIGGPLNALTRLREGGLSGFQTLFDGRVEGLGNINGWSGRDLLDSPLQVGSLGDLTRIGGVLSNDFRDSAFEAARTSGSATGTSSFATLSRGLSSSFGNIGNSMGNFGSGLASLGRSITNITGPVNQMSLAVSSVGSTLTGINSTLNAFGINTGLGTVASQMQTISGRLGVVSAVGGLPQQIGAIGTQMGAAGAQINRAIESMRTLPGATSDVTNSISRLSSSFTRGATAVSNSAGFLGTLE